jgi:hypothetical protein
LDDGTHFERKILANVSVHPNYMAELQFFIEIMYSKVIRLSLELFGDTPGETGDTQICRDTMVENHCIRLSIC